MGYAIVMSDTTDRAAKKPPENAAGEAPAAPLRTEKKPANSVPESGGPKGPEPTRYGDWERNGRCVDF